MQQQQMNNQPIQQQLSQPAPPPDYQQQHKVPIKQRNAVSDKQSRSGQKSFKFSQHQQPDRAPVQQNNPLSSTAEQNQQPKESVIEKKSPKDHLNYNVNADIKHAMEAYDQEQRDLVKPVEIHEEKVPGRDLKEDRSKRSAIEMVDVEVLNNDKEIIHAGENFSSQKGSLEQLVSLFSPA